MFRRNLLKVLPFLAGAPLGAKYFKNEPQTVTGNIAPDPNAVMKHVSLKVEDLVKGVEDQVIKFKTTAIPGIRESETVDVGLHVKTLWRSPNGKTIVYYNPATEEVFLSRSYDSYLSSSADDLRVENAVEFTEYPTYNMIDTINYFEGGNDCWFFEKPSHEYPYQVKTTVTKHYKEGHVGVDILTRQSLGISKEF